MEGWLLMNVILVMTIRFSFRIEERSMGLFERGRQTKCPYFAHINWVIIAKEKRLIYLSKQNEEFFDPLRHVRSLCHSEWLRQGFWTVALHWLHWMHRVLMEGLLRLLRLLELLNLPLPERRRCLRGIVLPKMQSRLLCYPVQYLRKVKGRGQ